MAFARFTSENYNASELEPFVKMLYKDVSIEDIKPFENQLALDALKGDQDRDKANFQLQAEKLHTSFGYLKDDGLIEDEKRNENEILELRQAGY